MMVPSASIGCAWAGFPKLRVLSVAVGSHNAHYPSSRKAMATMILGFSRSSNLSYTTA